MGRQTTCKAQVIEADEERDILPILKVYRLDKAGEVSQSNVVNPGSVGQKEIWSGTQHIPPPYDLNDLCTIYEHSNSLRPNVEGYAVNIDGFGHRFVPVIDLDSPEADKKISNALYVEKGGGAWPTDAEITAKKEELRGEQLLQLARAEAFFAACCRKISFVTLRKRTRIDMEITGNGWWEVVRDLGGRPAAFNHCPPTTVRMMPLDRTFTDVEQTARTSDLGTKTITAPALLRRYVQIYENRKVFFKEYGDPRIISRKSGQVFESLAALQKNDPDDGPATELLHFGIYAQRTPYGLPRWLGVLLEVLGSRAAAEVNYLFFDNKSIPPMAITVNGGRLSKDSTKRVTDFLNERIKGRRNYHSVLILEADGPGGNNPQNGRMRIEFKPLTSAVQSDGLFQNYDERNGAKVGQAFRMPPVLRGATADVNRATAEASLTFSEVQVFQPERTEFDDMMNLQVLPSIGVTHWRMVSNSPITRDPETMSEIVRKVVNANILTPDEGRDLLGDVFNRHFPKLKAQWTKQPVPLTLAGIQVQDEAPGAAIVDQVPPPKPAPGGFGGPADRAGESSGSGGGGPAGGASADQPPQGQAQQPFAPRKKYQLEAALAKLLTAHHVWTEVEGEAAEEAFKAGGGDREVVIKVPRELLEEWITPDVDDEELNKYSDSQARASNGEFGSGGGSGAGGNGNGNGGSGDGGKASSHDGGPPLHHETLAWMRTKAKEQGRPTYADMGKMRDWPGGEKRPSLGYKAPAKGNYYVVQPSGAVSYVGPKKKK